MANLANKYRPKTFDELTEQSIIVEILKSICNQPQLEIRNFLFIGPAGCGKTTLARCVANILNSGSGEPLEIDAASHNGVDSVREIIQQASTYPVGAKYKVFIMDECFPGNTWIATPSGNIQLKDIREGDSVYNMTGQATVTRVFQNSVKIGNLISVRVGDKNIVTTKDHLFFTDDGWTPACRLQKGDILYDTTTMQTMRANLRSELSKRSKDAMQSGMSQDLDTQQALQQTYKRISERVSYMWEHLLDSEECRCNNLLNELWKHLEITESKQGTIVGATCKTLAYIYLSQLWETTRDPEQRSSDRMQFRMCYEACAQNPSKADCDKGLRMVWEFIYRCLEQSSEENMLSSMSKSSSGKQATRSNRSASFSTNETSQSDVESQHSYKDVSNSREEWDITQSSCITWWERALHQSADDAEEFIRRTVDTRISCVDSTRSQEQSKSLSYELQTRPSLSGIETRNRGGWCRSQYEIATVVRREKGEMSTNLRVDSVEIYQPGHNDELFRSSFSDTELSQEYVTMYDLEISGHPSYYVDNILVHNCHAFSQQAWQMLLKTLEEGPAKSIFVLCTTNPEKIPATILSRVQTFQLSKISLGGITDRLIHVIECENKEGRNITYNRDAVSFIAKMAQGGMRDALTLLDKALSYSTDITSETLMKALNLPEYNDYFALLSAYAKKDNVAITRIVNDVYNSGVNFIKWFEGFHSFVMNVVKYIFLQDIEATMIPSHYLDKISKYSTAHSIICLRLANKLLKLTADLKTTQYLQEVALTYLCSIPKKGE